MWHSKLGDKLCLVYLITYYWQVVSVIGVYEAAQHLRLLDDLLMLQGNLRHANVLTPPFVNGTTTVKFGSSLCYVTSLDDVTGNAEMLFWDTYVIANQIVHISFCETSVLFYLFNYEVLE